MNLTNKTIWITGASSGIGEACALEYARLGATLILSARNKSKLEKVGEACSASSRVYILPMDISNHKSIPAKAKEAISKTGIIDILLNNAGVSQRGFVVQSSLEIDKELFDVNFFGNTLLTREVLPHMLNRRSGNIVVISSVAGKVSTPLRSGYSASKHALHGWYDALRAEVASNGVRINMICPGYIKTNISINAIGAKGKKQGVMDKGQAKGMSAEKCAKQILSAIAKNKRVAFIGGKEILAIHLRNLLPWIYYKMLDKMAAKLKNR